MAADDTPRRVKAHQRKISVIGLGYVGLPVAVAFGKKSETVGFDINPERIEELLRGFDRTNEVQAQDLKASELKLTSNPQDLKKADFHIIAVPTPVDTAKKPDLTPVIKASQTVGQILKSGDIVVYESTVYPGTTEEECVPVLEKASGLKFGKDFTVGYSPERINPGDKEHTFKKIKKVVSGSDALTLEIVASVYESVVEAGVHRASSIQVAESAKIIENIQRDVNIALMNELAMIFQKLGIDTQEVLAASRTKWNFLPFSPGLVGGHCIGVDPFYMAHKAAQIGYHAEMILSGRRINDSMGAFVASQTIRELAKRGTPIRGARITVLGFTFKENIPDVRNTKVIDIIRELEQYGVQVVVYDPWADPVETKEEYKIQLLEKSKLEVSDAVILAVAHDEFKKQSWNGITSLLRDQQGLIVDVKGLLPVSQKPESVTLWRL